MKMIALLFKDLIRGGVVIIITAAAVMVSLYSILEKKILP